MKLRVSEYLTNIESKKIKKQKSRQDTLLTSSNKKEKTFRLIVKFIGKKDGKLQKKRFTIEDNENKILRCANCGALNSIFSEDLAYFE